MSRTLPTVMMLNIESFAGTFSFTKSKVSALLAPFYSELEVELHKDYLDFRYINRLKERLHTNDPEIILAVVAKSPYGRDKLGFDDQGIYRITTWNSIGHWNGWSYDDGELVLGEERWKRCLEEHQPGDGVACYMCRVAELPEDIEPLSVITPDGIWHELEDFDDRSQVEYRVTDEQWSAWCAHVRELFSKYGDHLALGLDFHR